MKKHHVVIAVAILLTALLPIASVPATAAPTSQAVADYNAGKYAQAASGFETLKQSDPNNAMVRYYLALCRERLSQRGPARYEYEWIAQFGDDKLKALAAQGMARLNGGGSAASGSAVKSNRPIVRTVLEFSAEWCEVCKKFAPVFEATKRKYSDLQFQTADFDHDKALVKKYRIEGVPTVLFLDASGKEIYAVNSFSSVDTFSNALNRFR